MKTTPTKLTQLGAIAAIFAVIGASVSCTTTYDAYGRPVQSVTPEGAAAGVAAAGLLGYAISKDRHDDHHHHHHNDYYSHGRHGYYDKHGHWHRY